MLKYKGYIGHFYFDEKVGLFQGNVANSNDILTFQGKSIAILQQAFRATVDEYIAVTPYDRKNKNLANRVVTLQRDKK